MLFPVGLDYTHSPDWSLLNLDGREVKSALFFVTSPHPLQNQQEKKLTQTQTWRKLKSKKGGEIERRRKGEAEGQEGGRGREKAAAPPEGPSHHTEACG